MKISQVQPGAIVERRGFRASGDPRMDDHQRELDIITHVQWGIKGKPNLIFFKTKGTTRPFDEHENMTYLGNIAGENPAGIEFGERVEYPKEDPRDPKSSH